jgi:hypothetical protein
MNDQELIKKLQSLKAVKPEASWKQETRDVLLAQISNTAAKEVKINIFETAAYNFKNAFSFLPNTAWAVICLLVILTGGSMGVLAAKNSKPGDTFYVAKVWKEKIQLAMTLDQTDKAKLQMKLASAQALAITEVLSSPNFNAAANPKKAAELAQNFQQEINTVKENYSVINNIQNNIRQKNSSVAAQTASTGSLAVTSDDVKVGIGNLQKATDSKVYTVESGKDSKGVQVYDPRANIKSSIGSGATSSSAVITALSATSSGLGVSPEATSSAADESENINNSLDKASQSFNTKDFSGAKDILNQVGKIIDNIDSGSVKGATEVGTSSTGGDSLGASNSSSTK